MRSLDVLANPPFVNGSRNFSAPAFIGVGSGPVWPGRVTDRSNRVFVRARPFRVPGRTVTPGVYASTRRCSATSASVPLSAGRLPGTPVKFEQFVDCTVRGRVLVRVPRRIAVVGELAARTALVCRRAVERRRGDARRSKRTKPPHGRAHAARPDREDPAVEGTKLQVGLSRKRRL